MTEAEFEAVRESVESETDAEALSGYAMDLCEEVERLRSLLTTMRYLAQSAVA